MFRKGLAVSLLAGLIHQGASATPVTMGGNYVRASVSDRGSLGNGSAPTGGMQFDPSGTGNFSSASDFIQPGTPMAGWTYHLADGGNVTENNSMGGPYTNPVALTGTGFDNYVRWSRDYGDFTIQNDYYFNQNDPFIRATTTVFADVNLVGQTFAVYFDPDQDGNFSTTNTRGRDLNHDGDFVDAGDLAQTDYVASVGQLGTLGALYSTSSFAHNTGIPSSWNTDTGSYLFGTGNSYTGDSVIGMGFDLGNLAAGQSLSFSYAYVFTSVLPGPVPEATLSSVLEAF